MDVKKLIIGFLVLAGAASASATILSAIGSSSPAATMTPEPTIVAAQGAGTAALGGNAFLPQAVAQNDPYTPTITLAASTSDPGNLTDSLADGFLNGVVSANPNGPTDDGNGNPILTNPDTQAVAMLVASTTAAGAVTAPDWDLEANSQSIKTASDSSPASVSAYSGALSNIVSQHFVSTNLEGIVSNPSPDASQAGYVQSQIQAALGDTLALQTPAPLKGFQESFVKVLIYEKNTLGLLQDANVDPVRTSLVLEQEQTKYDAAVASLQNELQKSASVQGFSFGTGQQTSESGAVALMNRILGIKTANAQWLTFDAANFSQWIESFVKDLALQILKNTLIALIQKKVLAWVQGNGVPRFIQQWGTTFLNAYTQTALSAINSQMSCVPSFYAPQMRLTLGAFYNQNGNANVCANSFQAALGGNTFQQFYNNFSNGGFVAYGASILPSGNYYGGLFFNAQVVDNTAQNARAAATAKAVANNGHAGDQICADGSDPNGVSTVCSVGTLSGNQCVSGGNVVGTPITVPNDGTCANGQEPTVTTPGTFTGYAVSSAIDAPSKLITAANDIAGLLNSLVSSLLNSLASLAINAAGNVVNNVTNPGGGGVVSVNPTTIQGGGTNTIPPIALGCNPPTQTVSSTINVTIGALGGTNDANGNPPLYTWAASNGTTATGFIFSGAFAVPGTYFVTLTDSAGDPASTCRVLVQ